MTIPLIDKIKPKNNGQFPMYDDVDGYGGYQVRTTHADRNSIPALNRKEGMLVFTQSDGYFWQLGPSLSNGEWFPLPVTGGSGIIFDGDLSGNPVMQFVVGLQGNPVSGEMPEDGYVLTWDHTDGYWKPISLKDNPGGGAVTFGGDLSGDGYSQTVIGIQNSPVSPVLPVDGDTLIWDATDGYWIPQPITGGGGGGGGLTFAGDLSGNAHSQTVVGIQDNPVAHGMPNNNDVLTWDATDGYWKPEAAQGGGGGPGAPPNFLEGAMGANHDLLNPGRSGVLPIMLLVIPVVNAGQFLVNSCLTFTGDAAQERTGWEIDVYTGAFTVNGGSPAPGYYELPTIAGGSQTVSVITQQTRFYPDVGGTHQQPMNVALSDIISTGQSLGALVGISLGLQTVGDPVYNIHVFSTGGTISAYELAAGGTVGPAGPAGPPGPAGSLSGGASQATWSSTVFPNNGGSGFGAVIGTGNILEYDDNGNLTQITSDNTSAHPNYVVVADGSNANTTFSVQQGSFSNVGQAMSRSDRIVTQIASPGTYTIWNNTSSIGALLMVQVISCAGTEGPDQASWMFILDQQAVGSPTTLFTYNPGSMVTPTFSLGTGVQITVTGGQHWTVVALVAAMELGGTI